ncbi:MAG: hypothetical protein HY077_12215 [Elusimicrobia bacterium]|nr:hypothetical protein [Elusimicrobiota bacterium]
MRPLRAGAARASRTWPRAASSAARALLAAAAHGSERAREILERDARLKPTLKKLARDKGLPRELRRVLRELKPQ